MGKRKEDPSKQFALQCREGMGTDERCLLVGVFAPALTGGPAWCPYHTAIHRDRWPRDKPAFFEWLDFERGEGRLANELPGLNVRYNPEEVWEAVCGRKRLPQAPETTVDRGIRSRELAAFVVGDWADGPFRGIGEGLIQKVLDRRMTGTQALALIEAEAAKVRAAQESEAFA